MAEAEALALSVREDEPKEAFQSALWWYNGNTADLLAPYGAMLRERQLRQYWYAIHNTIFQGAVSGLVKRIVATPWEISGGRNLTRRYQDLLQQAEFGKGYKTWLTKVLTDYYTQDGGGVMEVIARGNKERPLAGPVVGLAHLDRHRCAFTNNVEHPVAYFPAKGGVIYLHRTRVQRLTDMVSPDESLFDNGFCALSRIVGVTNAQLLMGRYQNEKLGNEPPAGLIVFNNVKPHSIDDVRAMHDADRHRKGVNTYNPVEYIEALDPANPATVEFVPFSTLPDHFNDREYTEIHVNKVALALNDDPQEIWPLTGLGGEAGRIFVGSGTQSLILDEKGKAKGYADALTMIERILNLFVLPESLEFKFKFSSSEQDKRTADTAQVWVGIASTLVGTGQMDTKMANRLLANQVGAFADVLLDTEGKVRLPDDDRLPDDQIVVDDSTDAAPPPTSGEPVVADSTTDLPPAADQTRALVEKLKGWTWYTDDPDAVRAFTREFMNTRADFIRDLTDLFRGAMDGDLTRRRAGIVQRGQMAKYGRQAMIDGLADGGVEVDALEDDDQKTLATWLAQQSTYVTNALDNIYKNGATFDPEDRAIMWVRKSLQAIYLEGVASADKNGLYEFYGPDGEESCATCVKLKGQKHRLKQWIEKRFRPQVDTENFECGGWRCEHDLRKTTGRAHGRWPKAA